MGLEETFEIISNSKLIPQEHPLFKAFIRSNEQLKTVPDQEKALNFDMDIYFTGRYSRLVKKIYWCPLIIRLCPSLLL